MRYGHGTTNDSPQEKRRRATQPGIEEQKRRKNHRRSITGKQVNELGIVQGQNGEQGETTDPRNAYNRGKVRH